jgi:hypothetical protein
MAGSSRWKGPSSRRRRTGSQYLCHGAYPTQEYGRIVFDYMGPPDRQPPFPVYGSFVRSGYWLMPGQKYFYPSNWLQIMENAMDAAHTGFGAAAKTSMTGSNGRRQLPIASNGAGRHNRPAIPLAEIVCRDHFTESGCPGCVIDLCQGIHRPFRRAVRT